MERVLQIQSLAFLVYGLGFFAVPDLLNEVVLGWEGTDSIFGRIIGGAFIGVAWIEWRVASSIRQQPADVWPFVLIPTLFVAGFVWERLAGTYDGSDLWWWVNIGVSAVFMVVVGASAIRGRP